MVVDFEDEYDEIADSIISVEENKSKNKEDDYQKDKGLVSLLRETTNQMGSPYGGRIKGTGKKKYKTLVKPRPYAVNMDKMMRIYSNLEGLGINKRYKPIFAAQYLFGGRITEILNMKRGDVELVSVPMDDGSQRDMLEVSLLNLKHKNINLRVRQLVSPTWGKEKQMAMDFLKYIQRFDEKEYLFQIHPNHDYSKGIHPNSRIVVWQQFSKIDYAPIRVIRPDGMIDILTKWMGSTHYLRRCRLTHLARNYEWNENLLKEFAGWTTTAMVSTYVSLGAMGMREKFLESAKKASHEEFLATQEKKAESLNDSTSE